MLCRVLHLIFTLPNNKNHPLTRKRIIISHSITKNSFNYIKYNNYCVWQCDPRSSNNKICLFIIHNDHLYMLVIIHHNMVATTLGWRRRSCCCCCSWIDFGWIPSRTTRKATEVEETATLVLRRQAHPGTDEDDRPGLRTSIFAGRDEDEIVDALPALASPSSRASRSIALRWCGRHYCYCHPPRYPGSFWLDGADRYYEAHYYHRQLLLRHHLDLVIQTNWKGNAH